MITGTKFGLSVVVLSTAMGMTALAQSATQANPAAQDTTSSASASGKQMSVDDSSTYATGKPLEQQSKEGFWGHMNPFARKKWINRQLDPVKDRLNELDQLQAKNANEIKDVDQRAQNGIRAAQSTAEQANQTASTASQQAGQAQQLAQQASDKTNQISQTVANLDQYRPINNTDIRFRPGQTVLNQKAKDALDQVVSQLQGQKGYVVEVAGYSRSRGTAGLANSQKMTQAVVRYLAEHQIPVWRIHSIAMGNAALDENGQQAAPGSVVRVSLMENSLAALNSPNGSSPIGATQPSSAQPSPQGAASQPPVQPQQ